MPRTRQIAATIDLLGPSPERAAPGTELQPTAAGDPFGSRLLRAADVQYRIPFDRLGPGPHLLTIEATMGGTTFRRDVRFGIK